jgi:small nuclear ribonucleoprotein (snRNP)-like protein
MTPPADGNPKKKQPKSLATFLRHFIGVHLSVELKNGKIIRGNLSASDGDMNLMLDDVESSLGLGLSSDLAVHVHTIHIRGSTIRYIHFPNDLPLATTVKNSLALERSASGKYQRVVRRNTK